jgi:hypothetical protein
MVIGKDFLDEHYVYMGFQSAHAFETVYELSFVKGVLTKTIDLSKVERIRRKMELADKRPEIIGKFFDYKDMGK